jgi:hypothetical protein
MGYGSNHRGRGAVGETGQDRKEVSERHVLTGRSRPRTVRTQKACMRGACMKEHDGSDGSVVTVVVFPREDRSEDRKKVSKCRSVANVVVSPTHSTYSLRVRRVSIVT